MPMDVSLQVKRWSNTFPKRQYSCKHQVSSQQVESTQSKKLNKLYFTPWQFKWPHDPYKKEGGHVLDNKSSRHPAKMTNSENSRRWSSLNDPSLIRDLVSRGQFVGTENACLANKSV